MSARSRESIQARGEDRQASLVLIVDLGPEQAETLQALVSRLAAYGDAPAVIEVGPSEVATVSFAQLVASADELARELRANGVEPGEPVGIVAPNSAAWIGTCLGILAAGASVMPLDVKQGEPERNALIAANGCRIVFVADGVSNGKLALGQRRFARSTSIPAGRDVVLLLHTSGTTGTPKAVPLSHTNVLANLRALVAERLVDRDVRALLPLPLHHVYLNTEVIDALRISRDQIESVVTRERHELERREKLYRDSRPRPKLAGKTVILVEDGVATGSSMHAAVACLRLHDPARIVVAIPVAPVETLEELRAEVDEVVCWSTPEPFIAVGAAYDDFGQVSDNEVRALLDRAYGQKNK